MHKRKLYLTRGMLLFGDLDWPLNASRGFVSISWASCWITYTNFDKCCQRYIATCEKNLYRCRWGQSRSPNIVPFHTLGIVSSCAIVTLTSRHSDIRLQKCRDLEIRVRGHSRSLKLSALNYYGEIFFKSLSYLYEGVLTNFSADFWNFRNFWPQFRETCGDT